ncbi:MAG: NYN domain-containing protein [Candidatus Gastranaerophilales bacterium]|nr:NYN domain-containing protein [Candidatus Gastranaerophilales bacterium]
MTKILVLIDGFNYYHRLKKYQQNNKKCVKWLNYQAMIEESLRKYQNYSDDSHFEIIYFSAIADWRGDEPKNRHECYINALKKTGVKIILGEFKKKELPPCSNCKQRKPNEKILKHEEKHTDVNIAITLLEKAFLDEFDDAYILSGDNDYVPAVRKVKELFPHKRIIICPPPQKFYCIDALVRASQEKDAYRFKWNQVMKYQFPNNFEGLVNPWKIEEVDE